MFVFFILAALILAASVGVVVFLNPIYSALCLIGAMLGLAALFAQLDAHFLATVQIIVYAGAVMVLVVFLLMLLNLKYEKPKKMRPFYWVISLLCGSLFLLLLVPPINDLFTMFPDPQREVIGNVKDMGALLYSKYVLPFEIASILILAAMVGAVMLGKRSYGKGK
jgi:NADH-quinone oxidoreductase subunit J